MNAPSAFYAWTPKYHSLFERNITAILLSVKISARTAFLNNAHHG